VINDVEVIKKRNNLSLSNIFFIKTIKVTCRYVIRVIVFYINHKISHFLIQTLLKKTHIFYKYYFEFFQETLTNFVMKKKFAGNCCQFFCKIFCIKHFSQQIL